MTATYGGPGSRATRRCVCDDVDATIYDDDATIDDVDDNATIDEDEATIDSDVRWPWRSRYTTMCMRR